MPRRLPLSGVRPTQLYLSSAKLASAVERFDFGDPDYGPLPAFEHEGDWYLADGHTRAFCAHLAGEDALRVERDEDLRAEYDFDVYLAAIEWCGEAGVETVPDLAGRVVDPGAYESLWLERCRAVAADGTD